RPAPRRRPASFRSRLVPASRCGRAVRVLAQGVSAAGHTIRETGGELPGDDSSGLHRTLPPGGVLRQNLVGTADPCRKAQAVRRAKSLRLRRPPLARGPCQKDLISGLAVVLAARDTTETPE